MGGPETDQGLVEHALIELAESLGLEQRRLTELLEDAIVFSRGDDPLTRGAYSYVAIGGLDAASQLAEPVADTVFAGEATERFGGTVQAALASGNRAASEIKGSLRGA